MKATEDVSLLLGTGKEQCLSEVHSSDFFFQKCPPGGFIFWSIFLCGNC